MWTTGNLENGCKYCMKHFAEPSEEYGIDRGRISKLEIKVDGTVTLRFDRGWDIEPEDEATQMAYAILLNEFN